MRTNTHSGKIYMPIIWGVVMALVISALSGALGAVFLDNGTIQLNTITYITFPVWLIASVFCTVLSGLKGEGKWALRSAIAMLIYFVILVATGILIFDGIAGNVIYGLIAGVVGYALGIFIIFKRVSLPKTKKIRKFKIR